MTHPCGCRNELDEKTGVVLCVHKCNEHLLWLNRNPSDGYSYYERMGAITDQIPQHKRYTWEMLEALKEMGEEIKTAMGDRALEIGAGLGMYCPLFQAHGYLYEAIEPSLFAAAWIEGAYGVRVISGVFPPPLPYKDETFLAIMAAHVLEHVFDMGQLVKECYRCLERGGKLFIIVPVGDDDPTNPDHRWFFSVDSLTKLLENIGFASIKTLVKKHPHESYIYCVARRKS